MEIIKIKKYIVGSPVLKEPWSQRAACSMCGLGKIIQLFVRCLLVMSVYLIPYQVLNAQTDLDIVQLLLLNRQF